MDDPASANLVFFVREWTETHFRPILYAQMRVLKGGPSRESSPTVLWVTQKSSDYYVATKALVPRFRDHIKKLAAEARN